MIKQDPARCSVREKARAKCGLRSTRASVDALTASASLLPPLTGTEDFTAISLKVGYLILRADVCFVEKQTNTQKRKKKDLKLHFGSKLNSVKSQSLRLVAP